MKRIALLSDTHSHIDNQILEYCISCDEIWHAGDIGSLKVANALGEIKLLKAVFGNIDGQDIRIRYPETQRFFCEGVDVLITHIGGRPEAYVSRVKSEMQNNPPKIFICGHSHLLLVEYVKKYNCLHLNPGAAGKTGLHQVRTLLRFTIDGKAIRDMEVVELGRR